MKTKIVTGLPFFFLMLMLASVTRAQVLSGTVYERNQNGQKNLLPGVNVFWLGTTQGTFTNEKGKFQIDLRGITDKRLVFSFLGYKTDTLAVTGGNKLSVMLMPENKQLNTVEISEKVGNAYLSMLNPRKVQVITKGEIYRAACCNLAESFETNASVDVNYTDAITGAKQIQLLGLSGIYSQVISENVPLIRGLASSFGLSYIPGSWMESIQVSKGTSSVINGFESITGQINVEYKKPATSERFFLNLFGNSNGRLELNSNASYKLNDRLSTMVMAHVDDFRNKIDRNHDNFLDIPLLKTYNIFNRWDYINPNHFVSRFGIKYLDENRDGGYMNFNKTSFKEDTTGIDHLTKSYGIGIRTRRVEAFWKNGFMFPEKPYKSVALILSGILHDQTGFFGLNQYNGREKSFYAQLLYQSRILTDKNKFTAGLSFQLNDYQESYNRKDFTYLYELSGIDKDNNPDSLYTIAAVHDSTYRNNRTEQVPGAFLEYTFTPVDAFTIIAGIRVDDHNKYGTFYTPRLHLRYQISETANLRGSIGKGYRTANVFAENYSLMASQRKLYVASNLKQEEAWNYGVNFTKEFKLLKRKSVLELEYYRTDFLNQVILDLDSLPESAFFYNLLGKSYSNSFQAQLTVKPLKNLSMVMAYRVNHVRTTIGGKLREKPMVSTYKGLVTLSYATRFDKWKFDVTGQFNGPARIPETRKMPAKLQRGEYAPAWFNLLAQVTKKYKNWDFYIGGENLTNFTQKDPITEPWAPYHTHFDTSMVWGPLVGMTVYAGLRYTLQ